MLVLGGFNPDTRQPRSAEELRQLALVSIGELHQAHATLGAVIVNRVVGDRDEIRGVVSTVVEEAPVWTIGDDPELSAPTVAELFASTDAQLVSGDAALVDRAALGTVVAGMSMENVLDRLIEGGVLVVPGDRADVVVGVLLAQQSETFPNISGIILNGGFDLPP